MASGYLNGDKYAPLAVEWNQQISTLQPTWSRFCNVRNDNVIALQNYADITPASLASWDGSSAITESPSDKSYGSFAEQTVTADGYARKLTIKQQDIRLDPSLLDRKAAELFDAAGRTIEKSVYAALEAGFSTAVDNGSYSGNSGGTTNVLGGTFYLSDDTTTQSNGLTDALSATSLAAARQKMVEWKTWTMDPMGLGYGPMALVVSPKNEDLALQLVGSPLSRETFTSTVTAASGALINPQAGRSIDVVVSPYLTADDDDWFLIETGNQSPVIYWTQAAPHMVIAEKPEDQSVVMSVSIFHKVFIQTPPNGIIASNVA